MMEFRLTRAVFARVNNTAVFPLNAYRFDDRQRVLPDAGGGFVVVTMVLTALVYGLVLVMSYPGVPFFSHHMKWCLPSVVASMYFEVIDSAKHSRGYAFGRLVETWQSFASRNPGLAWAMVLVYTPVVVSVYVVLFYAGLVVYYAVLLALSVILPLSDLLLSVFCHCLDTRAAPSVPPPTYEEASAPPVYPTTSGPDDEK